MAYPSDIPSFTPIAGTTLVATDGHANRHNTEGSAITALANVLGTTNGTSVVKNFAAGDFAARINSSNVLQQTLQGTINQSVIGSPTLTGGTVAGQISLTGTVGGGMIGTSLHQGGTVANAVLGTPTVTVGSDAQGDVWYRSSGGGVARLGPGTNKQFLMTQGAAANPTWANIIQVGTAVDNTGTTIASATLADLGTISKTIVSTGGNVLINFSSTFTNSAGGAAFTTVALFRDTTELIRVDATSDNATSRVPVHLHFLDNQAAGTLTYKVQWRASSGTSTWLGGGGGVTSFFSVIEFKN